MREALGVDASALRFLTLRPALELVVGRARGRLAFYDALFRSELVSASTWFSTRRATSPRRPTSST